MNIKDPDLAKDKRTPIVMGLALVAIGLLVAIYYAPVWWVSLTAPNYPPEAFPDGVRIHFHMNGVFNGCQKMEKTEVQEDEALDCVHEMDTINHYVGMYPIAAGGVVEKVFSPFVVAMLGVMLLGFACTKPKVRIGIMAVGFAAVTGWMAMTFYGGNGLNYQSTGFIKALVTSMDQDAGEESSADKPMSAGEAMIAMLKAEMGGSAPAQPEPADDSSRSEKARLLESLRITFDKDQERQAADQRLDWDGSGAQMLAWHYDKSLGRYFNNRTEIEPMVAMMKTAGHVFFWGIVAAMVLFIWGGRRTGGLFYWLLILVPMALPLFFLVDYAGWLWWYGHSLNDMGAFTVKPFMPTVFGDGKVAQFATHSYPSWGFGLMVVTSVVLALAALLRRKQLKS